MQLTPRLPRRLATLAAALPLASVLAVFPLAATSPANAATGTYFGNSALDLVHANVTVPGMQLADAAVAPGQSNVNSAGLATPKGKQSYAKSTNVSTNLLQTGALGNLLVESEQSALPDNAKAKEDQLLAIPAAPLVDAKVATTSAHARWVSEGCLPVGEPISKSTTKVADAKVLPDAAGIGTLVETVGLNNGAASTTSIVAITAGGGITSRGLGSVGATQVAQISLLGGQVLVKVVGTPTLTAEATGKPGGAKVTYVPALLTVSIAGNDITLDPGNPLPTIALPGNPLLNLSLPAVTKTIAADGTKASGDTALLHVDVLSAVGTPPLASVDIGKTHVDATVPKGGIDCSVTNEDNPLRESHKDVSAASVNPGQTFDYTVAVPNRGNADITGVTVTDTVTPGGLKLVSSTPAAISTSGSTYKFNLGTIAANETKNIVMTFLVPSGTAIGTKFHNHAVITGVYKGTTYTKTADVDGPVIDRAGQGSCSIIASNKAASHLKVVHNETFNYYVHVFNTGGEPCLNVLVTDALESGVSYVSSSHSGVLAGNTVTWTVGTVAPGASETLTVTVKTVASSGTLHNKAHITADGATPADPEVNGPKVTDQSVLAPANPPQRPRTGDLAFTGLSTISTISALLLLMMGLGLRRYTQSRMIFRG